MRMPVSLDEFLTEVERIFESTHNALENEQQYSHEEDTSDLPQGIPELFGLSSSTPIGDIDYLELHPMYSLENIFSDVAMTSECATEMNCLSECVSPAQYTSSSAEELFSEPKRSLKTENLSAVSDRATTRQPKVSKCSKRVLKRRNRRSRKIGRKNDNSRKGSSKPSCQCDGCTRPACKTCIYCLDQKRYGGTRKLRKRCVKRKCCSVNEQSA
eukprot:TRINITY_DN6303_c0_g1_i1.p1 TRINITY_DN6303_c0_g1~~TRINITY_DN6303_c0_g1_i1.p1  ORF type:complete len:214 (-),score=10.49 TRINITY_DN6303_c0_g1_i1:139-780(-)